MGTRSTLTDIWAEKYNYGERVLAEQLIYLYAY